MKMKSAFFASITLAVLWGAAVFSDSVDMVHVSLSGINSSASSTLTEKGKPADYYSADKAFDRSSSTAWCEGKSDDGIGESVTCEFEPAEIYGVAALNGIGPTRNIYYKNNRVKGVRITIYLTDGKTKVINAEFKDNACGRDLAGGKLDIDTFCQDNTPEWESDKAAYRKCIDAKKDECIFDEYNGGGERFLLKTPVTANKIKMEILSVYPGSKYRDTCFTGITLLALGDIMEEGYKNLKDKKY